MIHFNFGLHDVRHFDDEKKATDADKGHRQVSEADYERTWERWSRMKRTGAKLIFAYDARAAQFARPVPGDEVRYNDIARRVMQKHNVAIDDLYAFALPKLAEIQLPANVHFKPEGSKQLADAVAASIVKAMGEK